MKRIPIFVECALVCVAVTSVVTADEKPKTFRTASTNVNLEGGGGPAPPAFAELCEIRGFDDSFEVTRSGTAAHLGAYAEVEMGCLDQSDFPVIKVRELQGIFQAANGDELWITAEADFNVFDNPPTFANGIFEIVGGTGRFASSEGGGTVDNVALFGDPAFVVIYDGLFTYDASDRSDE